MIFRSSYIFSLGVILSPFILSSYTYTTRYLRLEWHDTPYTTRPGLPISDYKLLRITDMKITKTYGLSSNRSNVLLKKEFDNLVLIFVVRRAILYFVYKVYIPMFLLIVFNMGSYWIPDTALPARMTLIVTTFLSSVFMLQSVSSDHVHTPTTTSLQVFVTFSIGMYTFC